LRGLPIRGGNPKDLFEQDEQKSGTSFRMHRENGFLKERKTLQEKKGLTGEKRGKKRELDSLNDRTNVGGPGRERPDQGKKVLAQKTSIDVWKRQEGDQGHGLQSHGESSIEGIRGTSRERKTFLERDLNQGRHSAQ